MKKIIYLSSLALAFGLGIVFSNALSAYHHPQQLKKVTGIGGIFFKCKSPKKMREWYGTHLGLQVNQYGAVFEWRQCADTTKKGFTQWTPFSEKSTYFAPSDKDYMVNYRVENLDALVAQLQKDSVTFTDKVETVEYGKFVHIMDPEGNKVELWEPNDLAYEKLGVTMGVKTTK